MRDPDLIVRAQRAAIALESAWCHWRSVHGLNSDPPSTVSSYVGYSLDAPWGEARIVFGICAEEAEQLAVLLERHDCVGPVHASVTARSVDGARSAPREGAAGRPGGAGLLQVPAPAPASAGQQPLSASAVGSRQSDPLAPRRRGPERDLDAVSPLTAPLAPPGADVETPIARAVSRALEASLASKRAAAAVPPGQAAQSGPAAQAVRAGKPQAGQAGRPGQAGQAGRTEEAGQSGQARQPGQMAQASQSGQTAQAGQSDHAGQADQAGQSDHAGQADQAGQAGHAGQADQADQAGQDAQAGQDGQTGQDAQTDQPSPEAGSAPGPEQRGGEDSRPGPEVTDAVEAPEVVAFRLKRPVTMADYGRMASATPADPSGTDDTVQTPAPGRLADGRNRVPSAAAHADAASWAASEIPGQAAVSDPAV